MSKGPGLDVTAAQWGGARAPFAGYGGEISLAAYGAFEPSATGPGPCQGPTAGILGRVPRKPHGAGGAPRPWACRVTLDGDRSLRHRRRDLGGGPAGDRCRRDDARA